MSDLDDDDFDEDRDERWEKPLDIQWGRTPRFFRFGEFKDIYDTPCSIIKSSLAEADCIWLGVKDADPKLLATDARRLGMEVGQETGWVSYPIPEEVHFRTAMHLTQKQAAELIPILQHFVDTGELPEPEKE